MLKRHDLQTEWALKPGFPGTHVLQGQLFTGFFKGTRK